VTRGELGMVALLALGVTASAIGVVCAKYLSRTEFVELQAVNGQIQRLEVQWSQLRLEEAALTTQPRVEEQARRLLDMHLPRRGEVRVLMGMAHEP
jgi:cell division protein FtsL